MEDIRGFAAIEISPGSVSGAFSRLESAKLITALASTDRRPPYQLTEFGVQTLRHHLRSMAVIADTGLERPDGQ